MVCKDGYHCPGMDTCCPLTDGRYGCCPLPHVSYIITVPFLVFTIKLEDLSEFDQANFLDILYYN